MTLFSLFFVIVSILFIIFVINSVNKNMLLIENSLIWLLLGIVMLIFSLFPGIPDLLANMLGFEVTSNLLLFVSIIFLFIQVISLTSSISKQSDTIKTLVQELSILKSKQKEEDER